LFPELLVVSVDPKMPCMPEMAKPATRMTTNANTGSQNLLSSRRLLDAPTIVASPDGDEAQLPPADGDVIRAYISSKKPDPVTLRQ
jgi:hypothetical protein